MGTGAGAGTGVGAAAALALAAVALATRCLGLDLEILIKGTRSEPKPICFNQRRDEIMSIENTFLKYYF